MAPRSALLSLLALLVVLPGTAGAQVEKPRLKFTSDWTWQGPESPPTLAADKGYFRNEGLDVTLDRGNGSTASATLVGSGAYDFGVGDISAMIVYNLQRPDNRLLAVYIFGDQSPLSIVTLKGRGITKPKDLEGKRIAGGVSSASDRMFPLFAKAAGVDVSTIKFLTVKEELREPMLLRNEADAVPGWASTGIMNLRALGIKEEDIIILPYSAYGIRLFGPTVWVKAEFAEKNPNTVKAMVRAFNRGYLEAIANPMASAASGKKRDPLLDVLTECNRLVYFLKTTTLTENVKANGVSAVDMAGMQQGIDAIKGAYKLPNELSAAQVFTAEFLPPKAQRMVPALGSCS